MQNLINSIGNGFQFIVDLITAIFGIIKALFLGLGTLLSGVKQIMENLIANDPFLLVNNAFTYISNFIGGPATVILSTLFILAILRIGIAFVFKILRLNINYNTLQQKTTDANYEADKRKSAVFKM